MNIFEPNTEDNFGDGKQSPSIATPTAQSSPFDGIVAEPDKSPAPPKDSDQVTDQGPDNSGFKINPIILIGAGILTYFLFKKKRK